MSKYYKAEDVDLVCIKNFANGDVLNAIRSLPTIEVSEDCISREWLEQEIEKFAMSLYKDEDYWKGWNEALEAILAQIELAPSVVPSRAEGEWIMHVDDLFPCESTQECSVCHSQHLICGNDDNYCPYCGAYMKGKRNET